MVKIKRMLIVMLSFTALFFAIQDVNGAIVSNESNYFKFEITTSTNYVFLYGSDAEFFNEFKVSNSNVIYINGVVWSYVYSFASRLNVNAVYFENSAQTIGFQLNSNMTYIDYDLLDIGDIIEIVGYSYSYDLTVSTNYNFDTGYLQYAFYGEEFVNFPKFPGSDTQARYNFINVMNDVISFYNVNKFIIYLPDRVKDDGNDITYKIDYFIYSYNAFIPNNEPLTLPADVVSIQFVSSYSISNSAPYFKAYFMGVYGDIIVIDNSTGLDHVELYPSAHDFVINMGYTQYTENYQNGYVDGKNAGLIEGEQIGYDKGFGDGEDFGYQDGLSDGFIDGVESHEDGGMWGVLWSAIIAPFDILGLVLLPGITLGMVVAVPIVFGLLGWILSTGKSRK